MIFYRQDFLLHKEKEAIASLNDYIKFSLDIEDQNIVFSDYFKSLLMVNFIRST